MDFSILDSRVLDCLGAEKWRRYALCRPAVNSLNAVFNAGILFIYLKFSEFEFCSLFQFAFKPLFFHFNGS